MNNTKLSLLIGTSLSLISTSTYAEQCTHIPDCATLGYTETSCPDNKGVRCPWNTNLMYCCKKCEEKPACEVKSCQIGDVLYSDKKCYICPKYTLPEIPAIGIVFEAKKAIGLDDLGSMTWDSANTSCNNYNIHEIMGWRLPTKDELQNIYKNRTAIKNGFSQTLGGNYFSNFNYWSSTYYGLSSDHSVPQYWFASLTNVGTGFDNHDRSLYTRPVLDF